MDESASGGSSASAGDGTSMEDLLYDAFYGAAIGGAAIALFFLAVDLIGGRPLFTPSLLGQALFTDVAPDSVSGVRLDMVAYFTVVHLVTFLVLGVAISYLCRIMGVSKANLPAVTVVIFVILTAAFFGGDLLVMGGVSQVIGVPWILGANAFTAVAMGLFLRRAHAPE